MNSDNHRGSGRDVPWRQVGTGLICDFFCMHCQSNQPTLGRKLWKKTPKLWHCAKCEAKAQAKASERMAA